MKKIKVRKVIETDSFQSDFAFSGKHYRYAIGSELLKQNALYCLL